MNSAQNSPQKPDQTSQPVVAPTVPDESMGITGAVPAPPESASQSPSVAPQIKEPGIPFHQLSPTNEPPPPAGGPPTPPPSVVLPPPPDDGQSTVQSFVATSAPPPSPPDSPTVISFQRGGSSKFPHMFVTILIAIVLLGFSGSFLFYQLNRPKVKVVTKPLITPPVSIAPTLTITPVENAFATSSGNLENPFATPSASVENPFGTAQNPFEDLSSSASGGAAVYTNPFAQ